MKLMPHNPEAEQAILCSMLINPSCKERVRESLSPSDFYRTAHQHIFKAISESVGHYDLVTISTELEKQNLLEAIGGNEYLASLQDVTATSAAVDSHVEVVKDLSKKRKMVELSQKLIENAGKYSSDQLSRFMRKSLTELDFRDRFGFKAGVDISNVYDAAKMLKEYDNYIGTLKQNRFITGIHEIDKRIRGVAGGETFYIIARAGCFKTATLQNLLKGYANNSTWSAIFFTIEMPISNVTERYHQIIQGSPGKDIEAIYKSAEKGSAQFKDALEEKFLTEMKGFYAVPTKVSIPDIAKYVSIIEKYFETKIGLIGIDYLGLMDGPGKSNYEVISKLATDIKSLAKLLNLPIVVLAQTSRKAGSGNVEIQLDMARDSGAIEESADFILGLYQVERPRLSTEDQEPDYQLICKILKNRKGPIGSQWVMNIQPENFRLNREAIPYEPPKKQRKDFQL